MLEYNLEQSDHLVRDILQIYLQHGKGSELYCAVAELLDLVISNIQSGWDGIAPTAALLRRMMDILYTLDTKSIDNWDSFIAAASQVQHGHLVVDALLGRDYRAPPKPPYYHISPRGYCRLCGKGICRDGAIDKRRSWHEECLVRFKTIYWPRETRRHVWNRDHGRCAICGKQDVEWQMDHRRPLIESQGDLAYWTLPNIQTLCLDHHRVKTAGENAERNRMRKKKRDAAFLSATLDTTPTDPQEPRDEI